jgi:hypothetical protein
MVPRRLKLVGILASAAVSALSFLAWTQPWFGLTLATGTALTVNGDAGAPALSALALAGLALSAALSVAGRVFGIVLGVLEVAIGALVVTSGVIAVVDPVLASASVVTAATAVSGDDSVRELVASVSSTAWPVLSIVFGALTVLAGLFVAATARAWPESSRKYQAVRLEQPDANGDAVDAWDALSDGADPTERA